MGEMPARPWTRRSESVRKNEGHPPLIFFCALALFCGAKHLSLLLVPTETIKKHPLPLCSQKKYLTNFFATLFENKL